MWKIEPGLKCEVNWVSTCIMKFQLIKLAVVSPVLKAFPLLHILYITHLKLQRAWMRAGTGINKLGFWS